MYAKTSPAASSHLILLDHGSPHPKSSQRLQSVASLLNARAFLPTRHAHMEITSPSLHETVSSITKDPTCTRILIHPLFISPYGKHMTIDIPRMVEECQAAAKEEGWGGEIVLTECMGDDLMNLVRGVEETIKSKYFEEPEPAIPFQSIMDAMKEVEASNNTYS